MAETVSNESEEVDKKQDDDVEPDDKIADEDDFELTNEIPTTTAKEPQHHDNVKHGGGYHASSAPTDFMKKKYTSELLHVSRCTGMVNKVGSRLREREPAPCGQR